MVAVYSCLTQLTTDRGLTSRSGMTQSRIICVLDERRKDRLCGGCYGNKNVNVNNMDREKEEQKVRARSSKGVGVGDAMAVCV